MTKYVYIYHGGGRPESEAEVAEVMAAWQAWLGGISASDPGAPFGISSTVHADGSVTEDGGSNPASGYSIVEAADKADALEKAKGCPILQAGGSVEVCEAMAM